jgi:hypothetical protein
MILLALLCLITLPCGVTSVSVCDVHTDAVVSTNAMNALTFECNSLPASTERIFFRFSVTSTNGSYIQVSTGYRPSFPILY